MIVNFERSFLKDIKKIKDKKIIEQLKTLLEEFEIQNHLINITKIKKLKGHNTYYRLKIGAYRLGFSYYANQIDIIRFLHRKDIYKVFP